MLGVKETCIDCRGVLITYAVAKRGDVEVVEVNLSVLGSCLLWAEKDKPALETEIIIKVEHDRYKGLRHVRRILYNAMILNTNGLNFAESLYLMAEHTISLTWPSVI
jgi:hypothetical protein